MTHVAFIESNTSGSGFGALQSARDLGYEVTFVTRDPAYYETPERPLADLLAGCDRVVIADTNDPDALIVALRRLPALDGVTSFGEYSVHTAALAARALGLPGPDPAAVARVRDKSAARAAFAAAGLPNPAYAAVGSLDDALAAADRIGYPCVIKPVDRSSSTNVRLVTGPDQLTERYRAMTGATRHRRGWALSSRVLVEEYLVGPEVSVETLACAGETLVLGSTSKSLAGGGAFAEVEHIFPTPGLALWEEASLEQAAVAGLHAVGLDHGPAHTEVRLTAAGPRLVEINARAGGNRIPDLIRLASGYDLAAAAVQVAVGVPPPWYDGPVRAAGVRFLVAGTPGVLAGLDGLDGLAGHPGVVEAGALAAPGERVRPPVSNGDLVGYVIAVGDHPEPVASLLAELAGQVRVRVQAEEHAA
ncbi:MAG TPA: ATP-grasp domain-containing protein [Mycobacteriales bacterium]|nr:ATP-grasp domain-containing protein [Mycobacteriales bacterium]